MPTVASIFAPLRTIPASAIRRARSSGVEARPRPADRSRANASAEGLALAQDRRPRQARLERLEREPLEQLGVVVDRHAPFVVVVGDHQGVRVRPVGAGPGAARSWLHHAATIASAGYAVAMSLRCYLGHGASGTSASMAPFVERPARARRRRRRPSTCPKRKAEDALPAFHLVVPSAADVAVGGHSFGGRVASLAAAEPDAPYAALVLFSYPLHPPGAPDRHGRPDRPLAGDPLPGPAAVGRVRPVRPDRAAAGSGGALQQRRAGHLSAARAHAQAGPRRRARPGRGASC